jgi:hypothetical protein
MTKEEYQEQLLDDRWSKKRHKILARDKGKCVICQSKERLEVHHLYYVEGHRAWEYPNDALVLWCNDCHKEWHDTHQIIVRQNIFSKGKRRKYVAPTKPKKTRKLKKPIAKLDATAISATTRKVIERGLRIMTPEERSRAIHTINKMYSKENRRLKKN